MTPSKEVLIDILKNILLSIDNILDNLHDNDGMIDPDTGETFEDIADLAVSQLELNKLIKELES